MHKPRSLKGANKKQISSQTRSPYRYFFHSTSYGTLSTLYLVLPLFRLNQARHDMASPSRKPASPLADSETQKSSPPAAAAPQHLTEDGAEPAPLQVDVCNFISICNVQMQKFVLLICGTY